MLFLQYLKYSHVGIYFITIENLACFCPFLKMQSVLDSIVTRNRPYNRLTVLSDTGATKNGKISSYNTDCFV